MDIAYIKMEVAGPVAMWTRPDTGDSPCSYPAPTYSAVEAIFKAVFWKPGMLVFPIKAEICKPIQYEDYTFNYSGPLRQDCRSQNYYQMHTTVLRNVCYRLYADVIVDPNMEMIPPQKTGWVRAVREGGNPVICYSDRFNKRLKHGQSYADVCLGWKEFKAMYFGPFRKGTTVETEINDVMIPSMLRQVFKTGFNTECAPVYNQNVVIRNGTIIYSPRFGRRR